jgi:UV DNA damage repair endonuclease
MYYKFDNEGSHSLIIEALSEESAQIILRMHSKYGYKLVQTARYFAEFDMLTQRNVRVILLEDDDTSYQSERTLAIP